MIKLNQIKINSANPRLIKDDRFRKLVKSIKEFPKMLELRPIVIDDDGTILGGNMRYRALKELGYKEIPDNWVKKASELTDEEKRRFIIEDNVAFGDWDMDMLANEWDAEELEEWGVEGIEYSVATGDIEEDEIPETPKEAFSKLGDLWILGKHRLLCGDSTKREDVEKLMNGVKADIAFSSPPYNAGTTATETAMGKTTKYNGNDDNKTEADYIAFLNSYIECAIEHCEYVFMNVQSISNNKIALIDVLYHNKDIYADTIIWDKIHGQPAMAENVMNSVFEYVHIFSKKANRAIGTIRFRGTVDNILHLPPQRKNEYSDIHNATFSVEFASHFIRNFAKESVLDQFGGTGTTLIACEQLNRTCYMMEIDPMYCDVIVKRYKALGKEDIILERDGRLIQYEEIKELLI